MIKFVVACADDTVVTVGTEEEVTNATSKRINASKRISV